MRLIRQRTNQADGHRRQGLYRRGEPRTAQHGQGSAEPQREELINMRHLSGGQQHAAVGPFRLDKKARKMLRSPMRGADGGLRCLRGQIKNSAGHQGEPDPSGDPQLFHANSSLRSNRKSKGADLTLRLCELSSVCLMIRVFGRLSIPGDYFTRIRCLVNALAAGRLF